MTNLDKMEESLGVKRRFSSMFNTESVEEHRIQTIAAIEQGTAAEARVSSVDEQWYETFRRATRKTKMPRMPPHGSGSNITRESFELLSQWYTEVEVRFCVVNGQAREPVWVDAATEISSLIVAEPTQTLHLAETSLDKISTANYLNLKPLNVTTAGELGPNRIVVVNAKMPGTVGLSNLGNTCYMNSSLQCILHTPELVAYFLQGHYKEEINTDNPIGYGGAAARAFADLAAAVWTSSQASYSPGMFKATMGRFNRSFAGYMQQDSQEFTAFLLDALHEDLNRIKQKPSTEKPELPDDKINDQEAIAALAKQCWDLHCKRNDSIILDLFTGLYKSTLVCPECAKVSITFDPFGDLTLPFPSLTIWVHTIYFIALDGTMLEFEAALQTHSNVAQLKAQAQQVVGRKFDSLVAEIHGSRIWQWYQDRDTVGDRIGTDDIVVVYETAEGAMPVLVEYFGRNLGWPLLVTPQPEEDIKETLRERLERVAAKDSTVPSFSISRHRRHSFSDAITYVRFEPLESPAMSEISNQDTLQIVPSPAKSEEQFELLSPAPEAEPETPSREAVSLTSLDVLSLSLDAEFDFKPFEKTFNPLAAEAAEKRKLKSDLSIDDCLELFSTPEVLGENDLWYCSRCSEFRNATKKIELWKTPDLFTIHLKRFRDIQSSRDKINDVVNFPIEGLDVTKHVLGADGVEQVYDLYAVDNHFGGLGGGHYTAFAKNPADSKWYYFNDSSVSDADPEDSVNGAAYLLFYRRRGLPEPNLGQIVQECRKQQQLALEQEQERERAQLSSFEGPGHVLGGGTAIADATAGESIDDAIDLTYLSGPEPESEQDDESSTISDMST